MHTTERLRSSRFCSSQTYTFQVLAEVPHASEQRFYTRSKKVVFSFITMRLINSSESSGFASKLTNMTKLISPMTIKPKWTAESETQEKLQHRMEGLERNTECLSNICQKHIDYYDLLLPSIINWEKSETKEDICNSIRY